MGGRSFHSHISHLVHPKTQILDRLEHAKNDRKNLANSFSDELAILKFLVDG